MKINVEFGISLKQKDKHTKLFKNVEKRKRPGSKMWPWRWIMWEANEENWRRIWEEWPIALIWSPSTAMPPSPNTRLSSSIVTITAPWRIVNALLITDSISETTGLDFQILFVFFCQIGISDFIIMSLTRFLFGLV